VPIGPEAFGRLLVAGTPFIDVRSEIEFAQGSIPGAVNLPILDTREREQVGICYRHEGQQAAIALGHQLVSGDTRAGRIDRWCAFARAHPAAHLFCWRGGLRSALAAQWMAEAGVPVPVVAGGYKALRRRLLAELEGEQPREPWIVVGGRTGSAKTALVCSLPGGIDLEGCAHHRGSSFGRRVEAAPSQVDFENAVAVGLLARRASAPGATVFLEDESRQIGRSSIPQEIFRALKQAPLAVVEVPREQRVAHILSDYICADLEAWEASDALEGFERFAGQLTASLERIQRRLGLERYRIALGLLQEALAAHRARGETAGHRAWIELLLAEYYDPMYDYQLGKAAERIAFRGSYEAVRDWCLSRAAAVRD